ncbi:MAG: response regulator [Rhodobacteraceae bacterium]|nr:response regulator [Paracoccaceae bacterium]
MPRLRDTNIYLAIQRPEDRSRVEDMLVLDGINVRVFPSAEALWDAFRQRPARFIISDRRFGNGFGAMELTAQIRSRYPLPYVYIVVLSVLNRMKEVRDALAAGVDDYIIKPHNPMQIRSRILVGLRWLDYIDSITAPEAGGSADPKAADNPTQAR